MNNNTNKVSNPMKVITGPNTRWSYANGYEMLRYYESQGCRIIYLSDFLKLSSN